LFALKFGFKPEDVDKMPYIQVEAWQIMLKEFMKSEMGNIK